MKRIGELKNQALAVLESKWITAALMTFVFYVSTYAILLIVTAICAPAGEDASSGASLLVSILTMPIQFGLVVAFYTIYESKNLEITMLFNYYNKRPVWTTMLLKYLYLMLWIIPGLVIAVILILLLARFDILSEGVSIVISAILVVLAMIPYYVKYYTYSMTEYIVADDLNTNNRQAIELSTKMMTGYKEKLFMLDLSFIGWALLSILTLGLGFLFLIPYWNATRAAFYKNLKKIYYGSTEENDITEETETQEMTSKTENTNYLK